MYSSPSDLMSYCSWAKKIQGLENLLKTIFLVSFSIIEIILLLATLLEMLSTSSSPLSTFAGYSNP